MLNPIRPAFRRPGKVLYDLVCQKGFCIVCKVPWQVITNEAVVLTPVDSLDVSIRVAEGNSKIRGQLGALVTPFTLPDDS